MKLEKLKICVIIICMLTAGVCYSCKKDEGEAPMTELKFAQSEELLSETAGSGELDPQQVGQSQETQETLPLCYVHICGEVKQPGVYELREGQRVFQAVEMAGGFTEDAAAEFLNMAQVIQDGMKLVVPSISQVENQLIPQEISQSQETLKININTASKEQLMTLKGIGESRAEDIIRFREEQGNFKKIEDIMKIPGIKDAAFQKIKDDITV